MIKYIRNKYPLLFNLYVIWAFLNIVFLFLGFTEKSTYYKSKFWPFTSDDHSLSETYDFSEFLVYVFGPLVLAFVALNSSFNNSSVQTGPAKGPINDPNTRSPMQYGIGTFGETAKAFLSPLVRLHFEGTNDINELIVIYSRLCGERATAARLAGQNKYSYLYDVNILENLEYIENALSVYNSKWKYDLAMFTFLAIYLESKIKRKWLRDGYDSDREISFQKIFEIAKNVCPNQVLFGKDLFVERANDLYVELEKKFSIIDNS